MIIETAFLNTCFTLLDVSLHQKIIEEHYRGLMIQKIYDQFELNYWNKSTIIPQYKYDLNKKKHCDLMVKIPNIQQYQEPYGLCENNWIEIKCNQDINKTKINQIKDDILRLCLLPKELQGKLKINGRYFILIQKKKNKIKNKNLKKIIKPGKHENIIMKEEKYELKFNCYTYEFTKMYGNKNQQPSFSGHLIKILDFQFTENDNEMNIKNNRKKKFTKKDLENQKNIAKKMDTFLIYKKNKKQS